MFLVDIYHVDGILCVRNKCLDKEISSKTLTAKTCSQNLKSMDTTKSNVNQDLLT